MSRETHTAESAETGPDAYKAALREFMARNGKPLRAGGGSPMIGYEDYDASIHASPVYARVPCYWVVEPGALLTETSYVEWGGTFGLNTTEMAVDVSPVSCACGKYTGVTLRFEGTFGDVLKGALGATGEPGIPL